MKNDMQRACLIIDPDDRLHDTLAPSLQRLALSIARSTRAPTVLPGTGVDLVLTRVRHADREQLQVCDTARRAWDARVVVFMERPDPVDRVLALTWGADAVLDSNAISARELEARLRALMRRRAPLPHGHLAWSIDTESGHLHQGGRHVHLSRSETRVLAALMQHRGQALSRAAILAVSGLSQQGCHLNVVDLAISRLRRKLLNAQMNAAALLTERGRGYRWVGLTADDAGPSAAPTRWPANTDWPPARQSA